MKQHIPNILTLSRIAMIPALIAVFYMEPYWGVFWTAWACWGIFTYAGATDYVDGRMARVWNVQSKLGKFLDPIADKLLVTAAIVLLVSAGRADTLPAVIILCREMLVSGLREFLADYKVNVPVTFLAKIKTTAQMFAIGGLLGAPGTPDWWHIQMASQTLFWISAILTLITGYAYLRVGLRHMN